MKKPTASLTHPKYRPDIDGLRALAVLSVVAFHAFPVWVQGGFVGVDVFFVISGFLISTIILENLDRGTFSFAAFYARRIKRIFPALFLVLTASYVFGWFALLADEYKQLGKHIAAGAIFVSNFALWRETGYFDNLAETKPLLHLWSLGIEEQFYILWPFALWLAWRKKINIFSFIVLVLLISFFLNIELVKQDQVAAFYSPKTRFWELLVGSAMAWLSLYYNSFFDLKLKIDGWLAKLIFREAVMQDGQTLVNCMSFFGFGLLVYGFFCITKDVNFPGMWAVIPVLATSLIIMAGPEAWVNRQILSHKIAVWFGLLSFPLYLWHWPLLSFARIVESEMPSRNIRILAVALSVVLAWLTYQLVERPIRSGGHGKIKVSILVFLVAVIGFVGYNAYSRDGYEFRDSVKGFLKNKNELVRTPAIDAGCLAYTGIDQPLFNYCRFTNANSHETVAVIGDSHAHVAYPGIAEYLKKQGKNTVLLANSNCPPFLGSPTGGTQLELDACTRRVKQLLQVVESKKDIKKVFVFSRGTVYNTGTTPMSGSKNVLNGWRTIPLDEFSNSAQLSINELKSSGKLIFYVSENPELKYTSESCLARPFKPKAKNCMLDKQFVYARQADYRKAFFNLKNVTVIDSIPAFCPDKQCVAFDENGALLYADDNHLSVAGSQYQVHHLLAPYLN